VSVTMSEGKSLFYRAGNWSTSADGDWVTVEVLLHENLWFDNSTAASVTTYELQGVTYFIFDASTIV